MQAEPWLNEDGDRPHETGMIFSGPMVRAIGADLKTQTRRPVKKVHRDGSVFSRLARGTRVYVRETTCDATLFHPVLYRADDEDRKVGRWRPAIHMPKTHARLWLKITNVRIERLHELTIEDAIAEGMEPCPSGDWWNYATCTSSAADPIESYRSLWQVLNGAGQYAWDNNPLVFVYDFKRIAAPGFE